MRSLDSDLGVFSCTDIFSVRVQRMHLACTLRLVLSKSSSQTPTGTSPPEHSGCSTVHERKQIITHRVCHLTQYRFSLGPMVGVASMFPPLLKKTITSCPGTAEGIFKERENQFPIIYIPHDDYDAWSTEHSTDSTFSVRLPSLYVFLFDVHVCRPNKETLEVPRDPYLVSEPHPMRLPQREERQTPKQVETEERSRAFFLQKMRRRNKRKNKRS